MRGWIIFTEYKPTTTSSSFGGWQVKLGNIRGVTTRRHETETSDHDVIVFVVIFVARWLKKINTEFFDKTTISYSGYCIWYYIIDIFSHFAQS